MRLSRNNIFEIHGMAFSGLKKLLRLDISHNLLTRAPSLDHLRSTLKSLDLSWNRIKSIGDSDFYLCIDIVQIYLDMNQINDFPNMQAISNTIAGISLQGNNISLVNSMYGIYFPRLDYLHLGYNQIESYCFPPWHFAPRLSQVYLQNNKISEMQFSHVTSHAQQTDSSLGDNPWYCDNALGWTERCVLEADSSMYCMECLTLRKLICTGPPEAQGRTPKEAAGIRCGIPTI